MQQLSAQTGLQVDEDRSWIGFSVPIASELVRVTGRFTDFDVTILYDESDMTKSSVKARIRAASIATGLGFVDDRLRGPELLAADAFPEIVFESARVRRYGDEYLVVGDLTIRGITKKIAVPFRIVASRAAGPGRVVLGASARSDVSWREYAGGSGWKRGVIKSLLSDRVTLRIDLWTRPAPVRPPPGTSISREPGPQRRS